MTDATTIVDDVVQPTATTWLLPVEALGFSLGTLATLRRNKVETLADVLDWGRTKLLDVSGHLDRAAISDVSAVLSRRFGIKW
jgi:hypothetical protein